MYDKKKSYIKQNITINQSIIMARVPAMIMSHTNQKRLTDIFCPLAKKSKSYTFFHIFSHCIIITIRKKCKVLTFLIFGTKIFFLYKKCTFLAFGPKICIAAG